MERGNLTRVRDFTSRLRRFGPPNRSSFGHRSNAMLGFESRVFSHMFLSHGHVSISGLTMAKSLEKPCLPSPSVAVYRGGFKAAAPTPIRKAARGDVALSTVALEPEGAGGGGGLSFSYCHSAAFPRMVRERKPAWR